MSSLLISSSYFLSMYISTELQFFNLFNSILDYSININILTEYDFINNILNINNNTSYLVACAEKFNIYNLIIFINN